MKRLIVTVSSHGFQSKLVLALLLSWVTPLATLATDGASGSARQIPKTWRDDADLHDVHFVDDQFGWAVGDSGVIWHTNNGGEIWRVQNSTVDCQLTSVHFVDRQNGFAAGGEIVPLTYRSQGVLLSTSDGGRTWQRTGGLLLPWITGLHFYTEKLGYAVGLQSALYSSGCWSTRDGGRTWRPIAGVDGDWTTSAFAEKGNALLASRSGKLAWLSRDRLFGAGDLRTTSPQWLSTQPFTAMLSSAAGVAGFHQPAFSADGGKSWQWLRSPISNAMDFQPLTVTTHRSVQWMAGSPGTRVFHSRDFGQTWNTIVTPAVLPIRRLYFHDDQHAWAVGSRGQILASKDGGATWKFQRTGAKRMALVGVFADEHDIPWELFTQLSAQQAYRVHIAVLAERGGDENEETIADLQERLAAAAANIGASSEVLTRLKYPAGYDATPEQLIARWTAETTNEVKVNPLDQLTQKLTLLLRTLRPDVLLTTNSGDSVGTSGTSTSSKGSQQLLRRLLLDATQFAAHEGMYTPQLTELGLSTWPVSRVVTLQPSSRQAPSLEKIMTDVGISVADLSRQSERLIAPTSTPIAWSLFEINDARATIEIGRRPMASLAAGYDSAQRRARTVASDSGTQRTLQQKKALQQRSQARRIANATQAIGNGKQRLEQLEHLMASNPRMLGEMLYELAMTEQAEGNSHEAGLLLQHLVERHKDHPLAERSLEWLIAHHSSVERLWWQPHRKQVTPISQGTNDVGFEVKTATNQYSAAAPPTAPEPIRLDAEMAEIDKLVEADLRRLGEIDGGVVQASAEVAVPVDENAAEQPKTVKSIPNHSPEVMDLSFQAGFGLGLQLAQKIRSQRPAFYGEPRVLMPLAAMLRATQQANKVQSIYGRLNGLPSTSIWRKRAKRELALLGSEDRNSQATDASQTTDRWHTFRWKSSVFRQRPILDGRFDDACYSSGSVMTLQPDATESSNQPPTQVVIGHDAEFLYLAAICPKRPNTKYQPKRRPRPRDADVTSLDRLRFSFDVNRDYASWWCLEIDHRGWTRDSLVQGQSLDFQWNPKYYVASEADNQSWVIEVAIPLDQLAPNEYRTGDWAIGVDRMVPQVGVERWEAQEAANSNSELQGMLRLEPF